MLAQKSNQQTQKKERRDDDDDDFLTSGGPNQMIKVGHSRLTNPLIPKKPPQGFNLVLGPVGEVGQRALAGFLAFPPSFAQQDGRWRIAVGDDFDIHGSYYSYRCQAPYSYLHGNIFKIAHEAKSRNTNGLFGNLAS